MRCPQIVWIALVGLLAGCEEYYAKKDEAADGSKPYISISSPGQDAVYKNTESIKIESLLSDKDDVKEVEVEITSMDSKAKKNKSILLFKKFPKRNPVVLDTAISATDLPAGEYLLTLNGIDGRTNVGQKEVKFFIK